MSHKVEGPIYSHARQLAEDIAKNRDLTGMNYSLDSESVKAIFLYHYDNLFYEITIKPIYGREKERVADAG